MPPRQSDRVLLPREAPVQGRWLLKNCPPPGSPGRPVHGGFLVGNRRIPSPALGVAPDRMDRNLVTHGKEECW